MPKLLIVLSLILTNTLLSASTSAGTGADALLQSAGKSVDSESVGQGQIQLSDPFLMQFFSDWQAQNKLSYDLNVWIQKILRHDFMGAAHLWSALKTKVPKKFEPSARTAFVYLLWRLDLPQSFVDEWITALADKRVRRSRVFDALNHTVAPQLDEFFVSNGIYLSASQKNLLLKLKDSESAAVISFKALALLRAGDKGRSVIANLPHKSPIKVPLAETIVLDLAKRGQLGQAGEILKQHVEPAIAAQGTAQDLSRYYLQVARLLYQAAAFDAAEEFYKKIPNSLPEFLSAREELTWIYLRTGNISKLRGELSSLSTGLFDGKFVPDVYVTRSISNLKLCYYPSVKEDLEAFVDVNKGWAKKIEDSLTAVETPKPRFLDFFSKYYETAKAKRSAERERLTTLAEESISAVLPAVGPQGHWKKLLNQIDSTIGSVQKALAQEYKRQWKNDQLILAEAIRKMKFVRVEFLSQMSQLARASSDSGTSSDTIKVSRAAAVMESQKENLRKQVPEKSMTFLFDGSVWSDELFRMRGVASGNCPGEGHS